MTGEPAVFISHASADSALAEAVVHLIELRTKLEESAIRCTSLKGYGFDAGVKFEEALRKEVFEATALVALLTPHSLTSTYVLFEIGARWGANKDLLPLLGRGATNALMQGPLKSLNALDLAQRGNVIRFIEQLATIVGRENERHNKEKVDDAITAVATEAQNAADIPAPTLAQPATTRNEKALRKMRAELKRFGSTGRYVSSLAELTGLPLKEAIVLLREEDDVGFEGSSESTLRARLMDLG